MFLPICIYLLMFLPCTTNSLSCFEKAKCGQDNSKYERSVCSSTELNTTDKILPFFYAKGSMIPLPPSFFFPIQQGVTEAMIEPKFNASIHLQLELPQSLARLDDFTLQPLQTQQYVSHMNSSEGSKLAFTSPFRIFSNEGIKVLHDIIEREKHHANKNHRNLQLRGLYYKSAFIRDLVTNQEMLEFLSRLAGEPILPHFLLMNAAAVNIGKVNEETVIEGVVDPWHYDSVRFVGISLISDITDMKGGELQIVKRRKQEALDLIHNTSNNMTENDVLTVSYERAGYCIFVQGSEMVHRVRKVESAKEPRLSLIMSFQPANPFQVRNRICI